MSTPAVRESARRHRGPATWLIVTVLLALSIAVVVVGGVALFRSAAGDVSDADGGGGSREEWVAAIPRQGEGYASGGRSEPDRCALVGWFENQLDVGMSPEDVVTAVGEPDSVEAGKPPVGEVWRWDLGLCTLDYDVYVLEFTDGELSQLQYLQG